MIWAWEVAGEKNRRSSRIFAKAAEEVAEEVESKVSAGAVTEKVEKKEHR